MRVAYVITSHRLPGQVLRLARTLRAGSPAAHIVLHHDDRRTQVDRAALHALGVLLVEPPSAVAWGEASHLDAMLRCLRLVLESTDADWLVLLSGQDYPVRPLAAIERSLAEADVDAFIEARPVARPALRRGEVDEFARRYHYRWRRAAALPWPVVRAAGRARPLVEVRRMPSGPWVGVPAWRSPFGADLVCHRGSDWFTLSRRAIEAVDRFAVTRADVVRHYRRTLIPTESFVPTALANDPSLRLSGDTRRHTRWDPGASGPRALGIGDLPGILASGADVARKFDETVDGAVLDALDEVLRGGA